MKRRLSLSSDHSAADRGRLNGMMTIEHGIIREGVGVQRYGERLEWMWGNRLE